MIPLGAALRTLFLLTIILSVDRAQAASPGCMTTFPTPRRTFPSLAAYIKSNESFYRYSPHFKGAHVTFNVTNMDVLKANGFVRRDSDYILYMDLIGKQINAIEYGAFNGLYCLRILHLTGNNVSVVVDRLFETVRFLDELVLASNKIEIIEPMAFKGLDRLKSLDLSDNHIDKIDFDISGLRSLQSLDFSFNRLSYIGGFLFSTLGNLRKLRLRGNQLRHLEANHLHGLHSLELLDLSNNRLFNFDLSHNFTLDHLEELNLYNNSLTSLDVHRLKLFCPQIEDLDLRMNPRWRCERMRVTLYDLEASQIHAKYDSGCRRSRIHRRRVPTTVTTTELPKNFTYEVVRKTELIETYTAEISLSFFRYRVLFWGVFAIYFVVLLWVFCLEQWNNWFKCRESIRRVRRPEPEGDQYELAGLYEG